MGRDSHSKGRGFESRHHILDGHFSHIFVGKIVMMFAWKRPELNKKEAGVGPFFKKLCSVFWICWSRCWVQANNIWYILGNSRCYFVAITSLPKWTSHLLCHQFSVQYYKDSPIVKYLLKSAHGIKFNTCECKKVQLIRALLTLG